MASSFSRLVSLTALVLALLSLANALKFDIAAHTGASTKYERCIRNFVGAETLVVVTATVDGHDSDGQSVSMRVSPRASLSHQLILTNALQIQDTEGNEYGRARNIVGEKRMAFTPHTDTAFDVCFENQLNARREFSRSLQHSPRTC